MSTLDRCFWGMGTLGIDRAIMMTMQPSLTTMKTVTVCEEVLHLRLISREATREWHAKGDPEEGAGKESESSLVRSLATRIRDVASSP